MIDTAPQNIASEEAVLGAILLNGALVDTVTTDAGLRPRHFYRAGFATIFQAMLDLDDQGEPIDALTVSNHLKQTGQLEAAGGTAAVDALAGSPPVVGHARSYATDIVTEARWRTRLTSSHHQQIAIAERDEDAYNAAVALTITDDTDRGRALTGPDLADQFDAMMDAPTDVVPSPYAPINNALYGGARRGDTTIISGWSSHGKSLIGAAWVEHIADKHGHAGIYTNEMSAIDLAARLVAGRCSVPFSVIMRRQMTDRQREEVRATFRAMPVKIMQISGWPWQDIARHMRRSRWDVCFLDLFHRLPGIGKVSEIDDAIGGLCNAAVQANAHLLIAAQLNQERAKDQKRPVPTGRDLRGSGRLFQDPANVLFIHQEQEENEETETWHPSGRGFVWLDKVRNGPPGPGSAVKVTLDSQRMRFDHGDAWRGRQHLEAAA